MLRYIKRRILKYKEKQIKNDFKTLKIVIQNYELLKPSVWKRIFKCLKKLYEMYPEVKLGILNEIKLKDNEKFISSIKFNSLINEYVNINSFSIIINIDFFNNTKAFIRNKANTNIYIELNDFIEYSIAHEFGHLLDIIYSFKIGYYNKVKIIEKKYVNSFFDNLPFSNKIINQVLSSDEFKIDLSDLSKYAMKSNKEAFAEAVAFGYFNSTNKLSNRILTEFKKWREMC